MGCVGAEVHDDLLHLGSIGIGKITIFIGEILSSLLSRVSFFLLCFSV
jgi:hypothetical protein